MGILTFFPTPLPDELFYGTIGRYQQIMGFSRPATNETLFSNRNFRSGFDVTCGLTALVESLGEPYNPAFILKNHTLYNAYYPFLGLATQNDVKTDILGMNSKIPYLKLRLPPTPYDDNKRGIKYCPICVKDDFEQYGTSYIHRSHQIMHINACHKHGCRLYEYNNENQGIGSYTILNKEHLCFEVIAAKENHIKMAKLANEFINANVEDLDRDKTKAKFNTLLGIKGLLTTTGRPKLQLIYGNLLVHFGPIFLSQYDAAPYTPTPEEKEFESRFSLVTSRLPDDKNRIKILHNWVWAAVGKRDVTLPLTKYLLLILFFGITINDFLQTKETYPDLKPAKSRKSDMSNYINKIKSVDDNDVLELLKGQYEKRMLHRPNLAITLGSLFRPIGLPNYERYRAQLPLSFEFAESKCKTTDAARMDRCKKIVDNFYNKGIRPTAPKVRLTAGLKPKEQLAWFESVRHEIEEYIEEKFSENTNKCDQIQS